MYILTSQLVKLSDDKLPLPWYHRAPLGLMSGTHVHVVLQEPHLRAFGDLLVSIVDPVNWRSVTEIIASKEDQPGVLAEMFKHAPPLNIVFAEAVTIDSGQRHDARLVVEPGHPVENGGTTGIKRQISRLKHQLENKSKFEKPVAGNPLHPANVDPPWMRIGEIQTGWVHVGGWRKELQRQAESSPRGDDYDTTMAVVSADTHRRMLRFVFPRRGAISVAVEHTDRPGAMGELAGALTGKGLNILSSLLRRGSAPPGMAEMVVVVEPNKGRMESEEVIGRVEKALSGLPPSLRVTTKISEAEEPVLYPRRPHEIAARPSPALEGAIRAVQATLPRGRYPIFISRRFARSADRFSEKALAALHEVLEAKGFYPVEATPQPTAQAAVLDEVKARMWASKAAILFVIGSPDKKELPAFSANLAHECGFMQGQGKPLFPLVQDDTEAEIISHANLQGLQLFTFNRKVALKPSEPSSIARTVEPWLEMLLEQSRR